MDGLRAVVLVQGEESAGVVQLAVAVASTL